MGVFGSQMYTLNLSVRSTQASDHDSVQPGLSFFSRYEISTRRAARRADARGIHHSYEDIETASRNSPNKFATEIAVTKMALPCVQ